MNSSVSAKWDRVVAAGDAEDQQWRWSMRDGCAIVKRGADIIEQLPHISDSDVLYARMEYLRKKAVATIIVSTALAEGLMGSLRPREAHAKKPSIVDITRMFG